MCSKHEYFLIGPSRKGFQLWESQLKDATPEILLAKITPRENGDEFVP